MTTPKLLLVFFASWLVLFLLASVVEARYGPDEVPTAVALGCLVLAAGWVSWFGGDDD